VLLHGPCWPANRINLSRDTADALELLRRFFDRHELAALLVALRIVPRERPLPKPDFVFQLRAAA
jgi:hypothetical protein